ncbi:unnamed protein product [Lampetra fluviatilis]
MISILSHLASGKHRTKYLQTYQPLEEATIPKELKGSERMMRIRDIAKEIVKKEGVKNFKVKMLKTDEFKPPVPIARQTDKKVIKRPYVDDDGYASDLPPMRSSGMSPLRMPRPPGPPRPGAMPMRAMASAGTASRMNDYSYSQYDSYM